jgi:MarR family transcriptional regulator, organic hydroperoxide resistance regulator
MRDFRERESVSHLAGTLFRRIARAHARELKHLEISTVHANVLMVLWLDGPSTIGHIQEALSLGSSTLTGAIDRMEAAGLVKREDVPGDRRAWRIVPTAAANRRRAAVMEAVARVEERAFARLGAQKRRLLVELLVEANAAIGEEEA